MKVIETSAGAVYIQYNLRFLARDPDFALLQEMRRWKLNSIATILIPEVEMESAPPRMMRILQGEGFLIRSIPDNEKFEQMDVTFLDQVDHRPAIFLCNPESAERIEPAVAELLRRRQGISVRQALEWMHPESDVGSRRAASESSGRPSAEMPPGIVEPSGNKPQTPADEAPSDSTEIKGSNGRIDIGNDRPVIAHPSPSARESSPLPSPDSSGHLKKEAQPLEAVAAPTPAPQTEPVTPQPSKASTTDNNANTGATDAAAPVAIRESKVGIKVKLIGIISGLLVASLMGMIFLATYFFRTDTERRIQETNLSITSVIGQKILSEIENFQYRAVLAITGGEADAAENSVRLGPVVQTNDERPTKVRSIPAERKKVFLRNNESVLYLGLVSRQERELVYDDQIFNEVALQNRGLDEQQLRSQLPVYAEDFLPSTAGATLVKNISPALRTPVVALSFPLDGHPGQAVILFIDSRKFNESFEGTQSEETEIYMVDGEGSIIAHGETDLILSAKSMRDIPIVESMLESKVNSQVSRYRYEKEEYLGSFKKLSLGNLGIISVVKEKVAMAQVYQTRRRNIIIMGIVLVLSVLVVYFYARSLSIPLRQLVGATRQIEEGQYEFALRPRTRDEVGVLTASFLKMANGLQERERMKDAFGKFVNKEIAEKALRGEIKLGGEKKHSAVFFSDLRGFTAMSESMEPEEVVEYLNDYFSAMVACVDQTRGVVDKFIGDAIMATWGAVVSHGNDTENAVNGAILMRKALVELNVRNRERGKPIARFGCGINSGPVISGQIGSEQKLEFTVIGDTVNLASRIEALNKPFGTDILISSDSYEEVKDVFKVVEMPAIKVKGKEKPQTIFCVLGRFDDPDCPSSLEEVRKMADIEVTNKGPLGDLVESEGEEKYEILEE
jgi:adenylate cyclase